MKSINPSIKFFALLIPTFFLAAISDPIINYVVFFISIILMILSKVKIKTLIYLFAPIIILSISMFMTGYKFTTADNLPVNAASLNVGSSSIWNGLLFSSRVVVFAGLGLLFALTTDKIELIHSFRTQLHLPNLFAYGLLAAWGVFPHMADEYKKAMAAFSARGQHPFPISPKVLRPLLVKSVRWSEELSIAMESKGFDSSQKRTDFNPPTVNFKDWIYFSLWGVLLPITIVIVR